MLTKLMPLFLLLLAAVLVAAGYCLAQLARRFALPGQPSGSAFDAHDFPFDDPVAPRH